MDKEELKKKIDNELADNNKADDQELEKDTKNQKAGDGNLESKKEGEEKITPEEELEKLKDKLARTFAEMENQRRRFEKEKEDAYEYGGYSFAKEALNLLDNLERSKVALENDEKLKNTDALKK